VGCSGYHLPGTGLEEHHQHIPYTTVSDGSFVPWDSLVRTDIRSTGSMEELRGGNGLKDE
jgi:hypothetical protein